MLVTCQECQKQVSTNATACPHCGAPRRVAEVRGQRRSGISGIIKFVLFLGVVAGLVGSGHYVLADKVKQAQQAEAAFNTARTETQAIQLSLKDKVTEEGVRNVIDSLDREVAAAQAFNSRRIELQRDGWKQALEVDPLLKDKKVGGNDVEAQLQVALYQREYYVSIQTTLRIARTDGARLEGRPLAEVHNYGKAMHSRTGLNMEDAKALGRLSYDVFIDPSRVLTDPMAVLADIERLGDAYERFCDSDYGGKARILAKATVSALKDIDTRKLGENAKELWRDTKAAGKEMWQDTKTAGKNLYDKAKNWYDDRKQTQPSSSGNSSGGGWKEAAGNAWDKVKSSWKK